MTGELAVFALAVAIIGGVGVALGILAAPLLGRLADRLANDDEERDGR